jgi:ribosome maturation factor RimP
VAKVDVVDKVRELIEPLVVAGGAEVVEIEQAPGILRVYLDQPGGIDLEALAHFSEQITDLLDVDDPVPGRYTLEVSSPGLERPLRTPAHFQRFVGTPVNVKAKAHVEGERRFSGELTEADETGVVVAGRRLAYGDIERARTIFEWGPTPKPGKPTTRKRKPSKAETS